MPVIVMATRHAAGKARQSVAGVAERLDNDHPGPILVVFAGLPGSGKTTLARGLADELSATFLRIDTIEAAIVSTLTPFKGNPVGYVAAQWIAEDQLLAARPVVADACNNLAVARQMWNDLSMRTGADLHWVEVICSDPHEHRRRVEERRPDWPGQGNPSWIQVQEREWEPFDQPRLLVDNLGPPARHIATIRDALKPFG